jgi:hypothetical protein
MQSNNAEDENQGQDKDNDRVNLQSGRFVGVEPCNFMLVT